MNFNHYFTNDEIQTLIQSWCEQYPQLVKHEIIGTSHENRPIWLLKITNWNSGSDLEKPALWIDANIHATELTGTTCAIYCVYQLLTGYGSDERITRLLDRSVFYIVPRVNPDGAALAMAATPRYIRSGVRLYPWEDKEEGLHIQDINQDGKILQMRFVDPNGDWKVSSLDPRLMEKRGPDEYDGKFYRLLTEGLIEDYDGYLIKEARSPEGLDFNRNFPFQWRTEGEQRGAGPYPASESEIRALVDFISKHPNISIALTLHTFSRVILRPYSTKSDDDIIPEDLWIFKKMGEIGTKASGYRCVSTFHDFKYHPKEVTTGAFDDWVYDHLGIYSFTIELWDLPTEAGIKDRKWIEWWREHDHPEDVKILKWIDEHGEQDSYVEWQEFDHPQLGKLEIGGWNSIHTWRNPPTSQVESEVSRHFPFVLSLGGMLPWLTFHTVKVEHLGNSNYRVTVIVENNGFLPSFTSEQAKNRQAVRPVRAELALPEGAKILEGKRRVQIGQLEGRSNKLDVSSIYSTSPTDNRGKAEWVIHAAEGSTVTINVFSERAGLLKQKIQLVSE
jgi:murein tripeptide amidase MpaA